MEDHFLAWQPMACHFNSFMIEAPLQSKSISCRLVMKELVALLYNIVTLTHFFCFYLDSFIIFHFIFNFHFIVFVIVIIIIYTYFSRESFISTTVISFHAAQKMKFSIKDFCSKCDQIRSFLLIWSHLLKKFLMEDFHRFHRFIQILGTLHAFLCRMFNIRVNVLPSSILLAAEIGEYTNLIKIYTF